ncbi:hypothetical protein [Methanospirillum stamsii]|uniref:hypothetical protein n=1 Tax=Methanospirillum stamsii TaxID=1277351 RepID=UPI0011B21A07|nr:hypothetical protein [Methanospirillum stamsii]
MEIYQQLQPSMNLHIWSRKSHHFLLSFNITGITVFAIKTYIILSQFHFCLFIGVVYPID